MNSVIAWFFPNRCPSCGVIIKHDDLFCRDCSEDLIHIRPAAYEHMSRHINGMCAPFDYSGSPKNAVIRPKFGKDESCAADMAVCMSECLDLSFPGIKFDMAVPVPMTHSHKAARGFNQSELLSKKLRCGGKRIKQRPSLLKKTAEIRSQHELSRAQRALNPKGAFGLDPKADINGARILLVDDIYTTGATAAECASVLKKAGAAEVFVITFAKTALHN